MCIIQGGWKSSDVQKMSSNKRVSITSNTFNSKVPSRICHNAVTSIAWQRAVTWPGIWLPISTNLRAWEQRRYLNNSGLSFVWAKSEPTLVKLLIEWVHVVRISWLLEDKHLRIYINAWIAVSFVLVSWSMVQLIMILCVCFCDINFVERFTL